MWFVSPDNVVQPILVATGNTVFHLETQSFSLIQLKQESVYLESGPLLQMWRSVQPQPLR